MLCTKQCQIKSGRWKKFLLPSQNIWILNENHCYSQSCNLVSLPNLNFKSWMLSNKRSHIIEENANSSKFPCGFCPKLLKSQKKLKSHERIHTEEKQYPCGYCDKMFSQRWWSLYFRVYCVWAWKHMKQGRVKIDASFLIWSLPYNTTILKVS